MDSSSEAGRKYLKRFVPSIIAYMVILFAVAPFIDGIENDALRVGVALLPTIPVFVIVWAIFDFVANVDELQRQIQLEGFAFSFAMTGLITLVIGFVEIAGFEFLDMIWVFPMLVAFWGIGVARANHKYS